MEFGRKLFYNRKSNLRALFASSSFIHVLVPRWPVAMPRVMLDIVGYQCQYMIKLAAENREFGNE